MDCVRVKNNKGVTAESMKVGDVFMHAGRICMMADHNGHCFAIHLDDGTFVSKLKPDTEVIRIDATLTYKVL